MEFVKKLIALECLIFFLFVGCFSKSVTYKEGTHIPLIFIMEQDEGETPSMKAIGPETRDFEQAIQNGNAAILVSQPIFYNYVYRIENWNDEKHHENQFLKDSFLSKENWDLYVPHDMHYFVKDYQLYLLIPRTLKNLFTSEIFNTNALKRLDILPSNENYNYSLLIEQLKPHAEKKQEKSAKEIAHDLKQIFATIPIQSKRKARSFAIQRKETWQTPIWDIYLSGHGDPQPDPIIANLTPRELQEFLTFFNNHIRVGVLIVASCYAGGNLPEIQFKQDFNNDKILTPLNFIIIVNSVGDIPTHGLQRSLLLMTNKFFFAKIFEITQNLGNDVQHSLQYLLSVLGEYNKVPEDIHAQANIPQIILPGGIEIQSLTINDAVMVLGKVKAHVAELENKPILVLPKKLNKEPAFDRELNLLVYPQIIKAPLILRSSHLPPSVNLRKLAQKQWKNLPTFSDIITAHKEFFDIESEIIFDEEIKIKNLEENQYLYPNIISMIHGNASHYFSTMIVEGDAVEGSGGVLMAIRDAFCNMTERPTLKKFYIDTLQGPNDISLIMKAMRALSGEQDPKPIEVELPGDGEMITLRKVFITTQGEPRMVMTIEFQLGAKVWEYRYDSSYWESPEIFKPKWWNFTENKDFANYEKKFKTAISQILKNITSLRVKKKQKPLSSIFGKEHRKRINELQTLLESDIKK
jgi:hypothetical protein